MRRTGAAWAGVALMVVALVAMILMSGLSREAVPFDTDSTSPDGLAAVRILLEERGLEVRQVMVDGFGEDQPDTRAVVFVPVPGIATALDLRRLSRMAERGATVIYGSPPGEGLDGDEGAGDEMAGHPMGYEPGWRELVETRTVATEPGSCTMADLNDLGVIDTAFAEPFDPGSLSGPGLSGSGLSGSGPSESGPSASEPVSFCYGTPGAAHFVSRHHVEGRIVVLSSPYLWANSRLQPAKELGGQVTDNAATAVRLISSAVDASQPLQDHPSRVLVVRALPGSQAAAGGESSPLELLPLPVKVLLVELATAFVIYVWWRSRRLGRPIPESLPVRVEGSEFTAAVGRLYENEFATTAAGVNALRLHVSRDLARRLGLRSGAGADHDLVEMLAQRSGRERSEIQRLFHGEWHSGIVELERQLEQLRMEVLDVLSGSRHD